MIHRVTRGLKVPLAGHPDPHVDSSRSVGRVALLADDYMGLRPGFKVEEGARVQRGQLLFEDKLTPGVGFTSPVEGTVVAIHRGERRAFRSLVIERSEADRAGRGTQVPFQSFTGRHPSGLSGDEVRALLVESGLWTAIRARPFSRVARPDQAPRSIFVTATDTEPLAPEPSGILAGRQAHLEQGLSALTRLTDGPVFFCTSESSALTVKTIDRVRHERFSGPHPSGSVGYHIHTLDPAGRERLVWHLHGQDVAAIGQLFATGTLDPMRIIGLGGPAFANPRLVEAPLGASTDELTEGARTSDARTISGSALSGRTASGPVDGYLGRYHRQVCVLKEGLAREFMGWAGPGLSRFSLLRLFVSGWLGRREFAMTTSTNGSERAIVPVGVYEQVMPFDIEPTYLLKALLTGDLERAEQLGCLELDEEDLALCTFVCPGKHDYGRHLREVLAAIGKED